MQSAEQNLFALEQRMVSQICQNCHNGTYNNHPRNNTSEGTQGILLNIRLSAFASRAGHRPLRTILLFGSSRPQRNLAGMVQQQSAGITRDCVGALLMNPAKSVQAHLLPPSGSSSPERIVKMKKPRCDTCRMKLPWVAFVCPNCGAHISDRKQIAFALLIWLSVLMWIAFIAWLLIG
jgi:hypothetical protein